MPSTKFPFKSFQRCPRCGGTLAGKSNGKAEPKRQRCRRCGYRVYHNPVTATEGYVVRRGRVLLLRRAREPRQGFWDIPGGFLELGEDPVVGLRREFSEELGVDFTRPKLFGAYATAYRFQDELTSVVVLAYTGGMSGQPKLNYENSEFAWIPVRQAYTLAFRHQQQALKDLQRWLKKKKS